VVVMPTRGTSDGAPGVSKSVRQKRGRYMKQFVTSDKVGRPRWRDRMREVARHVGGALGEAGRGGAPLRCRPAMAGAAGTVLARVSRPGCRRPMNPHGGQAVTSAPVRTFPTPSRGACGRSLRSRPRRPCWQVSPRPRWCVHSRRTLLRWSGSVTSAGVLIRLMRLRTRCTAPMYPLLRRQSALGGDAVVVVLAAIGVIPSMVRYPPRGGSC
jgi:hypothetical protein